MVTVVYDMFDTIDAKKTSGSVSRATPQYTTNSPSSAETAQLHNKYGKSDECVMVSTSASHIV